MTLRTNSFNYLTSHNDVKIVWRQPVSH